MTWSFTDFGEIPREEIRLVWAEDFFDGPIAGLALFDGQLCRFDLAEESDTPERDGWFRRYWVLGLSESQRSAARRWHSLFQTHVGKHFDYDADWNRDVSAIRPREEWDKFYSEFKKQPRPDYSACPVLGWFAC